MNIKPDGIDQDRQRCTVSMSDNFLMMANGFSTLHCQQRCELFLEEGVSIHAKYSYFVFCKKVLHGLPMRPGGTPQGGGGMIRQDESCIMSTHKIDTAGQL